VTITVTASPPVAGVCTTVVGTRVDGSVKDIGE
jgi:hypothetical protein